jgi:hypothetical protein
VEGLMTDAEIFESLVTTAREISGGHLTILRFTTNWRVGFGTYSDGAKDIDYMPSGRTFAEAAMKALHEPKSYPWRDRDGRSLGEQMGW